MNVIPGLIWTSLKRFLAVLSVLGALSPRVAALAQSQPGQAFIKGADLSLLQSIEDQGVQFREAGQPKDPLAIFKEHGCNYIRLRLFLNPDGTRGQVNTLPYTLSLAKRAKRTGFRLLLDFHYSDKWADPDHQIIPAEWGDIYHPLLVQRVFDYTKQTLAAFAREGCLPDMVQVGNEVTNGMMWPDGGPLKNEANWDALADLLKAGIRAVRESGAGIKVMIHVDKGGSKDVSRWFFDHCLRRGVDFDVIGLSYYPFWHGSLADLRENLASLSETYKKDIIVVETGYNQSGTLKQPMPFPLTPQGQKAFLEALIRIVAATPGGRGKGIFYWAPEWINGPGTWADRALFDRAGNVLPGIEAFELNPENAR